MKLLDDFKKGIKEMMKVTERRREDEGGFEAHCEEEQQKRITRLAASPAFACGGGLIEQLCLSRLLSVTFLP